MRRHGWTGACPRSSGYRGRRRIAGAPGLAHAAGGSEGDHGLAGEIGALQKGLDDAGRLTTTRWENPRTPCQPANRGAPPWPGGSWGPFISTLLRLLALFQSPDRLQCGAVWGRFEEIAADDTRQRLGQTGRFAAGRKIGQLEFCSCVCSLSTFLRDRSGGGIPLSPLYQPEGRRIQGTFPRKWVLIGP